MTWKVARPAAPSRCWRADKAANVPLAAKGMSSKMSEAGGVPERLGDRADPPMYYLVEWWVPIAGQEWAGEWKLFANPSEARLEALDRIRAGCASGHVLIVQLDHHGSEMGRAAASAPSLSKWSPITNRLPLTSADITIPPMGRDDIEGQTLANCRTSLRAAAAADLIDPNLVSAIIAIVQLAFHGVGPAVEFMNDADL